MFLKKFGPRISRGVFKLVGDPGYKKNVPTGKHFRKKNMGPVIVMVIISWPRHPGYQKNLDMEINRGAFK